MFVVAGATHTKDDDAERHAHFSDAFVALRSVRCFGMHILVMLL